MPVSWNQLPRAEDFRRLLAEHGLAHLEERLLAVGELGVHLRKVGTTREQPRRPWLGILPRGAKGIFETSPVELGSSRFGGLPDVPEGFEWPRVEGRPARFLLQLRCADLAAHAEHTLLPRDGMLWFFLGGTWNDYHACVVHRRELGALHTLPMPVEERRAPRFSSACGVRVELVLTLPDVWTREFESLGIRDEVDPETWLSERERFVSWEEAWAVEQGLEDLSASGRRHQIGGHAAPVQRDVRPEFFLAEQGQRWTRNEALWSEAERESDSWRLLLQVDSDEDLDFRWGDCGVLYFGMRADDLRAERFERAAVTWQTT
jgi:hypothetical protein